MLDTPLYVTVRTLKYLICLYQTLFRFHSNFPFLMFCLYSTFMWFSLFNEIWIIYHFINLLFYHFINLLFYHFINLLFIKFIIFFYLFWSYFHCITSSLTLKEESSDKQRLWSDCAYVQADLRLCWLHISHCWKFHAIAQYVNRILIWFVS